MTDEIKQTLIKEYAEKKQLYVEFASLTKNLLNVFLVGQGFKFQIFHREKDEEKLVEKIDRKKQEGKEYKKLDDIEDLAGVRIVFYLESDKKHFLNLFLDEFKNCIVSQEQKYDPKGYRGVHIIFRLDKERSKLLEYRKYNDLKCEIQVSTILFHAWSEVEHDIIYKSQGEKQLLKTLGLDDLEKSFQELMVKHIQAATFQLDYLNKKYKAITKAGKILSSDFLVDIISSKNNDEIYEILEVVEDFYHKKPEETLAIINTLIDKQPLSPMVIHRFEDQEIYGKTYKDLALKCIELLLSIRYFKPDEVLNSLVQLFKDEDKDIKERTGEVIKKLVKYDYNILTKSKLGYTVQRKVLDFILKWSMKDRLENIDFIEIAAKELLGSSVEGTSMKDEKTLVIHSNVVDPTDFLKKIRRETIDLVFDLYQKINDPKIKLRLLNVLGEASQGPSSINYEDNVQEMLSDDSKYLIDIYRKIIFDKSGKMIAEPAIAEETEQRLYWFCKNKGPENDKALALRKEILEDGFYKLFRLLVGDPVAYKEEEGWDVADKKREEGINKQLKLIKKENINDWIASLNKIASQYGIIEEWQFQEFRSFLQKFAEQKPEVANKILEDAFENNKPLKKVFSDSLLRGFRHGDRVNLWNNYVKKIIKEKDAQLVNTICFSLNLDEGTDLSKKIRKEDLDLLEDIIKQQKSFVFLKKKDDSMRHYALVNTLARIYKKDPQRIEELIIEEIKRNSQHLDLYFRALSMAVHRAWLDIKKLSPDMVKFIAQKMVELDKLDWHTQELLFDVSKNNLKMILDVFMRRIQKDDSEKKDKKLETGVYDYEAIPHHFNPDLKEFIAKHRDYKKIMEKWIENMKIEWTIYNYDVSRFLYSIGSSLDEIIMSIIKREDDASLMKAARALHSLEGVDLNLCIEIVRRTDDEKILNQVARVMYTTGMVSGEYGIAKAFENKAKDLEKYKDDESIRVKKFANKMIKSFQDSAKKEREQTDEEKMLRKIEFEG